MKKTKGKDDLCRVEFCDRLLEVCLEFQVLVKVTTADKIHDEERSHLVLKNVVKVDYEWVRVLQQNSFLVQYALEALSIDSFLFYDFHCKELWQKLDGLVVFLLFLPFQQLVLPLVDLVLDEEDFAIRAFAKFVLGLEIS